MQSDRRKAGNARSAKADAVTTPQKGFMMAKIYTDETREQIRKLYEEGLKYEQIAERVGLTRKAVSNQICRMKIANRKHKHCEDAKEVHTEEVKTEEVKIEKVKFCPKCNMKSPSIANFCWYCGTDVRSKRVLLLEKMRTLFINVQLTPDGVRNECVDILREINEYLKNEED